MCIMHIVIKIYVKMQDEFFSGLLKPNNKISAEKNTYLPSSTKNPFTNYTYCIKMYINEGMCASFIWKI